MAVAPPSTGPRRSRTAALALGAVAVLTGPVLGFVAAPAGTASPEMAAGAVVIVEGRGFGHGVGMAQDGAYWMGRSGRTATEILRLFFPGTTLGRQGGDVRVPLAAAREVGVAFPAGGRVGALVVPPGRTVRFTSAAGSATGALTGGTPTSTTTPGPTLALMTHTFAAADGGTVHLELLAEAVPDLGTSTTIAPETPVAVGAPTVSVEPAPPAPVPDPTAPVSAPLDGSDTTTTTMLGEPDATTAVGATGTQPVQGAVLTAKPAKGDVLVVGGKRYRGNIVLTASGNSLGVVNDVDVEQYLRGMGEMRDPRWPAATLQAQAIAARTYALKTMATAGQVCPTQRCQVYLGAEAEYGAMDAAVQATAGKVVLYQGQLASTFYSASGGGTMADPTEVFGPTSRSVPYLQAGVYPTGDLKAWTVQVTLDQLGRRFGYPGTAQSVVVSSVGPSGRAVEVTIYGTSGPRKIYGPTFDAGLGLRSTNFTLRMGAAPAGTVDTLPPLDDAAAVLEAQTGLLSDGVPVTTIVATEASSTVPPTSVPLTGAVPETKLPTDTATDTAGADTRPAPAASATTQRAAADRTGSGPTSLPPWLPVGLGGLVGVMGCGWAVRWAMQHREHDDV